MDIEIIALTLTMVGGFTGIYAYLIRFEHRLTRIETALGLNNKNLTAKLKTGMVDCGHKDSH